MSEKISAVLLSACCLGIAGGAYSFSGDHPSAPRCVRVSSLPGYNYSLKALAEINAIRRWVDTVPSQLAASATWHNAQNKHLNCVETGGRIGWECVASASVCSELEP